MDIHLEGVEIEGEGVDLRTALNAFKTAKQGQRFPITHLSVINNNQSGDFTEEIVRAAQRYYQMSTS